MPEERSEAPASVPAVTEKPKPPAFDSKGNLEVVGQHLAVIEKVGEKLANSGLCGAKSASQGFVVALFGYEHHMPMTDVGMMYHVITTWDGKTSLGIKGHQLVSNFQKRGGTHEVIELTEEKCTIHDKANHLPGKPDSTSTLTMKEVLRMLGWTEMNRKSVWFKNPKRMLYIRCSVNNIMMLDPGAAEGAPVDVDLEDAGQEPVEDQTPPRSEDNDLSRRVPKVEVTPPEPEKKKEPHGTFDGKGEHAAAPVTTEAPKNEDGQVPPDQRDGNTPKPNGKGKRQLKLGG